MPKKKPKPRKPATRSRPSARTRTRAVGCDLSRLRPPGPLYRDWFEVPRAEWDGTLPDDPRLTEEARDLWRRLRTLGPQYGGSLPQAAIVLDTILDSGRLPMMRTDGEISFFDPAAFGRGGLSGDEFRASVHQLHAAAALLVEEEGYVRVVAGRPDHPGGRWIYEGEPEARLVPSTCIPTQAVDELSAAQLAALTILRHPGTCGPEDAVRKLLARPDEYTEQQARDLVNAVVATKWVDAKGCDACPVAHHCTLEDQP